jgi:hypothetical protein
MTRRMRQAIGFTIVLAGAIIFSSISARAQSTQTLLSENFESYPAGTSLAGQGGWTQWPGTPPIMLSASTPLGTVAVDGTLRTGSGMPAVRHLLSGALNPNGVSIISADAYAFNAYMSHAASIGIESPDRSIYILWSSSWFDQVPGHGQGPKWNIEANGGIGTNNEVGSYVFGGFDERAHLELIIDGSAGLFYGRLTSPSLGAIETSRYPISASQIARLNTITLTEDFRDIYLGVDVDNIVVTTTKTIQTLFSENFESYPAGTSLAGQGGWTQWPGTPPIMLSASTPLGTVAVDGTLRTGTGRYDESSMPAVRHSLSGVLNPNGVSIISADAYAFNAYMSHGASIGIESADRSIGILWSPSWFNQVPGHGQGPKWNIEAYGGISTNNEIGSYIFGGFDERVHLELIIDGSAGVFYGRFISPSLGAIETSHYPISASQIARLNTITLTEDFRDIYLGVDIDNIVVSTTSIPSDIFFSQIAVGGGWSTSFTLSNTGSATVFGSLILTDYQGCPFTVNGSPMGIGSSFPISIPAGGTLFLTANPLNPADDTKTGWARVETSGGSLNGVARYQTVYEGIAQNAAGVLSSQLTQFATIPVHEDMSQELKTAFALANPTDQILTVKVALVDLNGIVLDDTVSISLNPRQQIARYFDYYFPDRLTFQGSIVLRAQGGGTLIAVALNQIQELFTAIPVIPSKATNIPN